MLRGQGEEVEMAAHADNESQESLSQLFERCYPKVYRYMYVRVRHRELAEDLTSDVVLRIVQSLRFYEHRGAPIEAWVYRIAANRLRDHVRRYAARRTVSLNEALVRGGRDGVADQVATWHDFRTALRELGEAEQQVLFLRHVEGLSTEETARVMGRSCESVKGLRHRAVAKLKGLLAAGKALSPATVADRRKLGGTGTGCGCSGAAMGMQGNGP